jgi:hypothetical protein
MSDAVESRKRAEECRQLAATVSDPADKAFWLRAAEDMDERRRGVRGTKS